MLQTKVDQQRSSRGRARRLSLLDAKSPPSSIFFSEQQGSLPSLTLAQTGDLINQQHTAKLCKIASPLPGSPPRLQSSNSPSSSPPPSPLVSDFTKPLSNLTGHRPKASVRLSRKPHPANALRTSPLTFRKREDSDPPSSSIMSTER